jgi:hypothetical protein
MVDQAKGCSNSLPFTFLKRPGFGLNTTALNTTATSAQKYHNQGGILKAFRRPPPIDGGLRIALAAGGRILASSGQIPSNSCDHDP